MNNNFDILKTEVEDLKKQISFLTKKMSQSGDGPEDNSSTENGEENTETTSPSTDTWITLYDKSSENATVNLGYTTGILGSTGIIADFPDLAPYKTLRIHFIANNDTSLHTFDITDTSDNTYHFLTTSLTLASLYGMSFTIVVRDGKRKIEFANCTKIDFYTTKYTGLTNLKTNASYHISKIEAK